MRLALTLMAVVLASYVWSGLGVGVCRLDPMDTGFSPSTASEIRVKMKSRQVVYMVRRTRHHHLHPLMICPSPTVPAACLGAGNDHTPG